MGVAVRDWGVGEPEPSPASKSLDYRLTWKVARSQDYRRFNLVPSWRMIEWWKSPPGRSASVDLAVASWRRALVIAASAECRHLRQCPPIRDGRRSVRKACGSKSSPGSSSWCRSRSCGFGAARGGAAGGRSPPRSRLDCCCCPSCSRRSPAHGAATQLASRRAHARLPCAPAGRERPGAEGSSVR
jgi:hypothetical protein